jgi:hypothetical protein
MSTKQTKFPKNSNRSIHQGTTIVGRNGLPIDALATLEPGISLLRGANTFSYSSPTITLHNSVDLQSIKDYDAKAYKYTGILLFTDSSGASYIIDQASIDNTAKTFNIYIDEDYTNSPSSITLDSDWLISEADLVNRLQTTSSAVIDSVEFRDVDVKLDLDGDPVTVRGTNDNTLEPNEDGSINVTGTITSIDKVYAVRIDEVNANLSYVGKAEIGSLNSNAVWQIQRVQKTAQVTSITWADGNSNFDNIWNNRASLTYI